MDRIEYQRILLTHAVHAMACDGEVHDDEVAHIRDLVRSTPYFEDLDAPAEIEAMMSSLRTGGTRAIGGAVKHLRSTNLARVQRLRLLEVVLAVVQADREVGDDERSYLSAVRAALDLSTADLVTRFPAELGLFMGPPAGRFEDDDETVGALLDLSGLGDVEFY